MRIQIKICLGEELCSDNKGVSHKKTLVRGHFRVVNGKKVYVKKHYRKKR